MAACRQSKGFSSDGSITDCRLLPVLRFPLSRCTSSPGSRATAVRVSVLDSAPFLIRSMIGK